MEAIDFTPLANAISDFGISLSNSITLNDLGKTISNISLLSTGDGIAMNTDTISCISEKNEFQGKKLICECCGGKIDKDLLSCLYCGTAYI